MTDLIDVARMTPDEYQLRMRAYNLAQLDDEYRLHKLAWQINQAQATNKKGLPIYRRFTDFFDYKKMEQKILGTRPQDKVLKDKNLNDMLLKSNK